MEFAIILSSLLEILKQTLKIFFGNGKLIPSITLLSFFLNSILLLSHYYSNKFLVTDYSTKLNDLFLDESKNFNPKSSASMHSYYLHMISLMRHELRLLVLEFFIFTIASSITSFFVTIATILVSAQNFVGKKLNVKELKAKVRESWKRALVTLCYTTLLGLGYALLVLAAIILPLELIFLDPERGKISTISIIAIVLASILFLYFAVVWTLAFVVSLLEDKYGYEALGRASDLAKGLKLQGFLLNLLYNGLLYATFRVWIGDNKLTSLIMGIKIVPFVLVIAVMSLIKAFYSISFAVLYFEGKKICGEEVIELQGYTVEYTKVPGSSPLISSDLP